MRPIVRYCISGIASMLIASSIASGQTQRDRFGCPAIFAARDTSIARAELLLSQKDYALADSLLNSTLRDAVGCEVPVFDDLRAALSMNVAYHLRARTAWARGNSRDAVQYFQQFAQNYERILSQTLMARSESDAQRPYRVMNDLTHTALAYLARRTEPVAQATALQILTSRNGRLIEMQGDRGRVYRRAGPIGDRLLKWRALRASLLLRGRSRSYSPILSAESFPHPLSPPRGTPPLMQAIGQLEFAEHQASSIVASAPLEGFSKVRVANEQLFASLEPQRILILYSAIERVDPVTGQSQLGADYVRGLLTRTGRVATDNLGPVKDIDAEVDTYLHRLESTRIRTNHDSLPLPRAANELARLDDEGKRLCARLFPGEEKLHETRRLTVVADGSLHRLPFAALPCADGMPILERFDVDYVSSLRALVRPRYDAALSSRPWLFGDPLGASAPADLSQPATLTEAFGALPYARDEVRTLSALLGDSTSVFTGADATEARLKTAHSPVVLHIAAHGHFIDQPNPMLDVFEMESSLFSLLGVTERRRPSRVANPWLHAYMAMAEYASPPTRDGEDGVLTNYEILSLDLEGTRLAVASACSSGIGPTEFGYGIYNLRFALALAGARAQVVSLWSVDDRSTMEFMRVYYEKMSRGMGTMDAFHSTQRQFLHDSTLTSLFGDPYHWAAFTIGGTNETLGVSPRAP